MLARAWRRSILSRSPDFCWWAVQQFRREHGHLGHQRRVWWCPIGCKGALGVSLWQTYAGLRPVHAKSGTIRVGIHRARRRAVHIGEMVCTAVAATIDRGLSCKGVFYHCGVFHRGDGVCIANPDLKRNANAAQSVRGAEKAGGWRKEREPGKGQAAASECGAVFGISARAAQGEQCGRPDGVTNSDKRLRRGQVAIYCFTYPVEAIFHILCGRDG